MALDRRWRPLDFEKSLGSDEWAMVGDDVLQDEGIHDAEHLSGWEYDSLDILLGTEGPFLGHAEEWLPEDMETDFPAAATMHSNSVRAQTAIGETAKTTSITLPALAATHSASNSSPQTRTIECPICRQDFKTGDELEMHAISERHRSFACSLADCNKRFFRRDMRTRHVAAHDASKHTCRVCQTKFGRRDHLQRHIRVQHPDEMCNSETKAPGFANADIKKVRESEPALRRSLSPDNLAIKMLDIANKFGSTEEGAQKAFACVVAHAALNAPEPLRALTPRTKRRLMSVQTKPVIEVQDLDVVETLKVV